MGLEIDGIFQPATQVGIGDYMCSVFLDHTLYCAFRRIIKHSLVVLAEFIGENTGSSFTDQCINLAHVNIAGGYGFTDLGKAIALYVAFEVLYGLVLGHFSGQSKKLDAVSLLTHKVFGHFGN